MNSYHIHHFYWKLTTTGKLWVQNQFCKLKTVFMFAIIFKIWVLITPNNRHICYMERKELERSMSFCRSSLRRSEIQFFQISNKASPDFCVQVARWTPEEKKIKIHTGSVSEIGLITSHFQVKAEKKSSKYALWAYFEEIFFWLYLENWP